jgi:diguanylate cyclase (GGDEF)-like protein/PAS domain S-box-containing protein
MADRTDKAPEAPRAADPAPPDTSSAVRPAAGRLLVVDADPGDRDALAIQFEQQGFRVVQAATGPDALALLTLDQPDLVLLDVTLPATGGLDLLRDLRSQSTATDLPVIVLTGRDGSEDTFEALHVGASDYLTRPVDFVVALTRVRTHLAASRAERALRESEERYALVAAGSNDGLFDWDLHTDRVCYSDRWATLLGLAPETVIPRFSEWLSRVHPDEQVRVAEELRAHLDGATTTWESEHRIRHADGHYRWVLGRGMARRGRDGRPVRLAGSLSDVTHAKVADPLTGLPNRLLFLDRLRHALGRVRSDDRPRFAVLFIDLDDFKVVNDSLGHMAGDELLVRVARRLEAGVRRSDYTGHLSLRRTVSRLGGDEFAILLEDIVDETAARAVADRLQQAMREPFTLAGRPVYTTFSIGLVLDAPRHVSGEELMHDADAAMYRAKRRGRGQCEVFTAAVLAEAQLREQLARDLSGALARNEIAPYYQPIVRLADGRLSGFEALVRWRHPERGLLSPDQFLPVVEETGLIGPLTFHVLARALADLQLWRVRFPTVAADLTMSVNLAPDVLVDAGIVAHLSRHVEDAGLSPRDVTLEIVERTLLDAGEQMIARCRSLREAGFGLALDDFGTGYSSLGYLHAFPLTTLKIDRTFVNRMRDERDEHVQVVRSIVGLAHMLGMDVTAEGVETAAQVRWLQVLDCVRGQGFLFERPLPAESLDHVLDDPHFLVPEAWPVEPVMPS